MFVAQAILLTRLCAVYGNERAFSARMLGFFALTTAGYVAVFVYNDLKIHCACPLSSRLCMYLTPGVRSHRGAVSWGEDVFRHHGARAALHGLVSTRVIIDTR